MPKWAIVIFLLFLESGEGVLTNVKMWIDGVEANVEHSPMESKTWRDLEESRLLNISSAWDAVGWEIGESKAGQVYKLECQPLSEDQTCHVVFFVYHCPPCSYAFTGGLPAILLAQNWKLSHCSPSFKVTSEGTHYPMVTFYRDLVPDEVAVIPTSPSKAPRFVYPAQLLSDVNVADFMCPKPPGLCEACADDELSSKT
eukprot:TRINITY_DN2959_c4_g1_i1.p1 TRINITY_DN2959_c4_g1~~TRINITY_DN2959_c4_g1_i1.p1  ORF type:complete len:223 (+),score=32.94 TRINITY_DN2959_c4_g1_i1:75-671(+)